MSRRKLALLAAAIAAVAVFLVLQRKEQRVAVPVADEDVSTPARTARVLHEFVADTSESKEPTAGDVTGRVLDAATREPLRGALVSLHALSLRQAVQTDKPLGGDAVAETDDAGLFRFAQVRGTAYSLQATADQHLPRELARVKPGDGELTILLERGGTELTGTVSDLLGGPVANAFVHARITGSANKMAFTHAAAVARTDEHGAYKLRLSPGAYELEAHSEDYATESSVVRIERAAVRRDFVLVPSGSVSGIVRDSSAGAPVPFARVYVRPAAEGMVQGLAVAAVADEQGRFEARHVRAGVLNVYAQSDRSTSFEPQLVRLGPGENMEEVVLWVKRAGAIHGRVVGDTDESQGIAGAMVSAFALDGQRVYFADEPSDEQGAFRISAVLPGSLALQTVAEGLPPALETKPLRVAAGEVTQVTVALSRGVTVRGRVQPPRRAHVRLEMAVTGQEWAAMRAAQANAVASAEAQEDGAFELSGLAPGDVRVVATASQGMTGEAPLHVADKNVDGVVIELQQAPTLRGRALSEEGAPLRGRVEVRRNDDHLAMMRIESLFGMGGSAVDEQGAFRIEGLRPGTYSLTLSDDEGVALSFKTSTESKEALAVPVEIPAQGDPAPLELVAKAQRIAVRGQVVAADGQPAEGVVVTAQPAQQGARVSVSTRRAMSESDGSFSLSEVIAGRAYTVTAEHLESAQRKEQTVRLQAGAPLRLQLEASGALEVAVEGLTGTSECTMHLQGLKRGVLPCNEGRATFKELAPGKYRVTVDSVSGFGERDVEVGTSLASTNVALKRWGQVRGRLLKADGAPAANTPLVLRAGGNTPPFGVFSLLLGSSPRTDPNGAFEIDRVPPGSVELLALIPGRATSEQVPMVRFDVAPQQTTELGDVRLKAAEKAAGPTPANTTSAPSAAAEGAIAHSSEPARPAK